MCVLSHKTAQHAVSNFVLHWREEGAQECSCGCRSQTQDRRQPGAGQGGAPPWSCGVAHSAPASAAVPPCLLCPLAASPPSPSSSSPGGSSTKKASCSMGRTSSPARSPRSCSMASSTTDTACSRRQGHRQWQRRAAAAAAQGGSLRVRVLALAGQGGHVEHSRRHTWSTGSAAARLACCRPCPQLAPGSPHARARGAPPAGSLPALRGCAATPAATRRGPAMGGRLPCGCCGQEAGSIRKQQGWGRLRVSRQGQRVCAPGIAALAED